MVGHEQASRIVRRNPSESPTAFVLYHSPRERVILVVLRPPLAGPRLALRPEGRVLYTLRRPWHKPDGRTQLVLEPVEFLRRLVAFLCSPCRQLSQRGTGSSAPRSPETAR